MKARRFAAFAAVSLACVAGGSLPAQPGVDPPPTIARMDLRGQPANRNAALLYHRALMLGSHMRERAVEVAQIDNVHPDRPEGCDDLLVALQDQIEVVLRASMLDHADWGIEIERGIETLLPELGACRQLARHLAWDADRCLDLGDVPAAAERAAAEVGLARHISDGGLLVSGLVSAAILEHSHPVIRRLAESGKLDPASRDLILTQLNRLDPNDPWNYRASLEGERQMLVQWTQTQFSGPAAGFNLARLLSALGDGSNVLNLALSTLDEAGLRVHAAKCGTMHEEIMAALDAPDPDAALQAVLAEIENSRKNPATGRYGALGASIGESVLKPWASVKKSRASLAETIALLQAAQTVPAPER